MRDKNKRFLQRKMRVRAKAYGTKNRPRLSVFRSNKTIYAQIIDDSKGVTLVSAKEGDIKVAKAENKTETARAVGEILAKKALKLKTKKVVFDRGAYKYHGRVKALAEAARKGGLEF